MLSLRKHVLLFVFSFFSASSLLASPVAFDWKPGETAPFKAARSFHGFLPDGSFLVAGGSDFRDGKKVYLDNIAVRVKDGKWDLGGRIPDKAAEGVSCGTKKGVFCAGGTDGKVEFKKAFILPSKDSRIDLPDLPEPVVMGAAASDGNKVYVVASKKVYFIDLDNLARGWSCAATIPGPSRSQMVAAIQNGDQKEKVLVVYGGYDIKTKEPLHDGYALVLSLNKWRKLANLPENTTTIGAAFLPSGHQHILMIGGFGEKGWIDRAINGSKETDPVKLGWQRKIFAYNCVTDAWCEYGVLAEGDSPRCGASAGLLAGKTPEDYKLLIVGGEIAPALRTDAASVASFKKTGKFGAMAWAVVGFYALLMVGMACFFIFKKKDENDYFRGGNKIPWYVAGMSIFATMLSSITFIAIPTQAYLQDWRYFIMAFFIIGMAPVAIYYYLPFSAASASHRRTNILKSASISACGFSALRRSSCL